MHRTALLSTALQRSGLLACLWLCSVPALALATTGGVTSLPTGKLNRTGVRVEVDSRWIDAVGYRPVRVKITALKPPVKYDRQFRVVLRPFGNRDQVSQIVELKEGTAQTIATILVPQDTHWHELTIDIFEDGRILEDLSGERHTYNSNWDWNEMGPGILIIDADAPERNQRAQLLLDAGRGQPGALKPLSGKRLADARNVIRIFKQDRNGSAASMVGDFDTYHEEYTPVSILREVEQHSKADILPPNELPEHWLALSCFDLIFISQADLIALGAQQPKQLQAIGEWTRSGRTLVVYESGEKFAGLAALEKALRLTPQAKANDDPYRGWRVPSEKFYNQALQNYSENPYANYPRTTLATPGSAPEKPQPETPAEPGFHFKKWGFVMRPAGLGQVVAFEGNPFPGEQEDWNWLFNSLHGSAWNPLYRTGATMQHRNEDFWNFLIPGIGQAPVFSFVVFITLFVTLIGPVNYYYLQKRQRLYLLLVTVPLGALLVTLGLFGYAVVVDGLGAKSRVRSLTSIDQRAGVGVSVSRQAYYASIAPSQGLGFDAATEIRPYVHRPVQRHEGRMARRNVAWDGDDQQLRNGFISSRTLSQLLVTKAEPTKARLQVGQLKGDTLPVTNELQVDIHWLVVRHDDGGYYLWKSKLIKPGTTVELTTITPQDAAFELKHRLLVFQPAFPEGYSENMHDTPLELIEGGPYRYREPSPADQATSLLERGIARYGYLSTQPLEPRTYVALTDNSPLVPLGTRTRQYGSVHVIEGSY